MPRGSEEVPSEPVVYYENWLYKKEGVNTWVAYWVVIRDRWIQFFLNEQDRHNNGNLVKTFELTEKTQCSLVERKKRRFPFSVNNGLAVYYMKCETELERYHWIFSLLTSSTGKPKRPLPTQIPKSMREKEAFKRKKEKERDKESDDTGNNETGKPNSEYHSRRRQKYADRNEKRQIRKEAKRNRKLEGRRVNALAKMPEDDQDWHRRESAEYHSPSELHRSQKIHLGDNGLCLSNSGESKRIGGSIIPENIDDSRVTLNERNKMTGAETAVKVDVVMHGNNGKGKSTKNESDNLGFDVSDQDDDDDDDEDINGFTRIDVISCTANVLPNVASDEDSDCESTANTSVTSPSSMLAGPDFPHDHGSPRDLLSSNGMTSPTNFPAIVREEDFGLPEVENVSSQYPQKRQQQQRRLSTDGSFIKRPSPRAASAGPARAPLKSVDPSSHRRTPSPNLLQLSNDSSNSTSGLLSPRYNEKTASDTTTSSTESTLQTPRSLNALLSPVPTPKVPKGGLVGTLDLPGTTREFTTSPKPVTKFSRFMDS